MSDSEELESGATRVMSLEDVPGAAKRSAPHAILLMVHNNQVFRLPLEKDTCVVGRATESDIKLDFPDVSRKHCRITREARGRYALEDLGSSGGTYLRSAGENERKLSERLALDDHDVLRIGAHLFHFIVTQEIASEDFPQLVPLSGGPTVQLSGAVCRVGRANADLNIPDPRVSSKHAIIETFGRSSVYVIDEGSANGTKVNDVPLKGARRLDEHDVVSFAGIGYRVSLEGVDSAKTMIGVVAAPGSERAVVQTNTLRFDEQQRVVEALASTPMDAEETKPFLSEKTGTFKAPEAKADEGKSLSRTGTYTGPMPQKPADQPRSAEAENDPDATVEQPNNMIDRLRLQLQRPREAMALRIGVGVVVLGLLLYPYVTSVSGECRLVPGSLQKSRAALSGRIEKVLVGEGQKVKKGEPLVMFAEGELRYELEKAAAALEELRKTKAPSRTALASAEREVERVQSQLDLTIVRAGISGKIVTASPQNLTNTVVGIGQELIEIAEMKRVTAEVLVPESEIADVAVGQPVFVRMYSDTSETYESTVEAIMPVAEKGIMGSLIVVRAGLANESERLIPGTTGIAKIIGQRQLGIVILFKKLARILK